MKNLIKDENSIFYQGIAAILILIAVYYTAWWIERFSKCIEGGCRGI